MAKDDWIRKLQYEEKLIEKYWKDVTKHIKRDIAYIWADEVREDFNKIKLESGRIAFILRKLHSYYKIDPAVYKKEIADIKNLIHHLDRIEAKAKWVKLIYMDLNKIISDAEREIQIAKADSIMSNISLEELTRIAREIERTPPEKRGNISNAEFIWLYTPGKPLQQLKRQKGVIAGLLMMGGSGIVFEDYSRTSAIAIIHNHSSGNMQPSLEDLNVLSGGVIRGENLRFSLIASTNLGIVTGFYELKYTGARANAAALIKGNNDIYRAHVDRKNEFLERNPEILSKMKLGDSILSSEEYRNMVSEAMAASTIIGRPRPLSGYRFENLRFVPE